MPKAHICGSNGPTSRAPRKCGQPISASFSELTRTNALQTFLNLISATTIASYKFRYNERASSANYIYVSNPTQAVSNSPFSIIYLQM